MQILPQQRWLEDPVQADRLLALVPDEEMTSRLRSAWARDNKRRAVAKAAGEAVDLGAEDVNVARWHELKRAVAKATGRQGASFEMRKCLDSIIFAFSYPRLDVEVSKHMNHLLKAPFCVHPKTGRVCVPIDAANAEEFDPLQVPTVASLLNELDRSEGAATGSEGWRETSMRRAVDTFERCFLRGLANTVREEFAEKTREEVAVQQVGLAW